jgi:hypothetical protein
MVRHDQQMLLAQALRPCRIQGKGFLETTLGIEIA